MKPTKFSNIKLGSIVPELDADDPSGMSDADKAQFSVIAQAVKNIQATTTNDDIKEKLAGIEYTKTNDISEVCAFLEKLVQCFSIPMVVNEDEVDLSGYDPLHIKLAPMVDVNADASSEHVYLSTIEDHDVYVKSNGKLYVVKPMNWAILPANCRDVTIYGATHMPMAVYANIIEVYEKPSVVEESEDCTMLFTDYSGNVIVKSNSYDLMGLL